MPYGGFRRPPYREEGYAVYAALPAIELAVKDAEFNLRLAQRQLEWLVKVRDHRAGQTDEQWSAEVAQFDASEEARSAALWARPAVGG
jgi:hypothetical protein